ncbi:hypothetical protein AYR66_09470 [Noviherbaspirillum denitrificans]|uniref:Uncharacterized protein n=1 Tax=Noviherbaspirillum denitrificans TaxID=1968433 RepID=A0A254TAW0_9BURK|nr:hypothetical protein AYR66_09470 [Noviherbaspirillum denitrificans]
MTKRMPPPGKKSFNLNVVVKPRGASAKREQPQDKLSREDISRCINIWASMYLTPDEAIDSRDLCLPSHPWAGRDPSGMKRFE